MPRIWDPLFVPLERISKSLELQAPCTKVPQWQISGESCCGGLNLILTIAANGFTFFSFLLLLSVGLLGVGMNFDPRALYRLRACLRPNRKLV